MEWEIGFSRQAEKFLAKQHLPDKFVITRVLKALKKLFHESEESVDIRKLSGAWTGYYRIRSGDIRIIFSFNAHERRVFIEVVDYRGGAYR